MTKIAWKPGTMLAPVPPVMVTCGTMEKPNVLTIAWTGIINSEPPLTYISVRPSRHSHDIIKEAGEFVINITNLELARACDYCGVKSGKNTDKIKEMNLALEPCQQVKAPMLSAAPISLECKVKSVTSYETHDMFLAEIVNVNIDDKYLEEDGRLALEKAGLLAFVHGRYYTLGRDLGAFGFSVDKSKENKTKPRKSKFLELIADESDPADRTENSPQRRAPARKRTPNKAEGARPFRKNNSRPYNKDRTSSGAERGSAAEGENRNRRPYNPENKRPRTSEERPRNKDRQPRFERSDSRSEEASSGRKPRPFDRKKTFNKERRTDSRPERRSSERTPRPVSQSRKKS